MNYNTLTKQLHIGQKNSTFVANTHTKAEGLQCGFVKHYKTTPREEFLVGEIHNIIWFINSCKLYTW